MTYLTFSYLRFCTVSDELNDRIYMLGGYYKTTKAYFYTISTNSWSAMYDSSLSKSSKVNLKIKKKQSDFVSQDGACTILYESRTKTRRLILIGGYNEEAQYNRLDSNSHWKSMTDPLSYVRFMHIVKLSEYEAYMMGGYSTRHGKSNQ